MNNKADLIVYLEQGIAKLTFEFPQYEHSTSMLFQQIFDFLDSDFEEMTDNYIYRYFLTSFKELICFAFETGVNGTAVQAIGHKEFFPYFENR